MSSLHSADENLFSPPLLDSRRQDHHAPDTRSVTENGILVAWTASLEWLPGTSNSLLSMPAFFSLNSAQRSQLM